LKHVKGIDKQIYKTNTLNNPDKNFKFLAGNSQKHFGYATGKFSETSTHI
jgi:hypothetical protein